MKYGFLILLIFWSCSMQKTTDEHIFFLLQQFSETYPLNKNKPEYYPKECYEIGFMLQEKDTLCYMARHEIIANDKYSSFVDLLLDKDKETLEDFFRRPYYRGSFYMKDSAVVHLYDQKDHYGKDFYNKDHLQKISLKDFMPLEAYEDVTVEAYAPKYWLFRIENGHFVRLK